ncbi:hypothetical protein PENARI_c031G00849 [Penicillium arizonense]|uniref:Uncharacterized protein n=1 Tax=Penicillium arizonense TaxID=1835702 RepID=A0A1F5L4Q4_PENAI|nr:hypothetical protein PENARI_c031G00849 [Penicillium arizonense]OGE48218.1 hypothetical protein PENARI_c031G00849 [Penicillium arizonense]
MTVQVAMPSPYSDIVEQNHRVGSGSASFVYTVSRAIVVKAVRSEVVVIDASILSNVYLRSLTIFSCHIATVMTSTIDILEIKPKKNF